jgi:hypothetical protein
MGKESDANSDAGWGKLQIFIYPAGSEIPPGKEAHAVVSSKSTSQ